MENKPLVSVIVPVYNVEHYLEDCLESILSQTYDKLEILLVDDGSTDGSSDICDKYAQTDERIQVIRQENRGAAAARRSAVLRAAGDYICFADADDKLDASMIEFLLRSIGGCDVVTSGCYSGQETGAYIEEADLIEEGVYENEAMKYVISNMLAYQGRYEYGILPYLVNKMFRAGLLKELMGEMHSALTYAEDGEVLFRYLLKCRSVRITHTCLYYYQYRPDSAMHLVNRNYMHDLNRIYLALEPVFEKHPQRETLMRQLELFVLARINVIPVYMGFAADIRSPGYVFPFSDIKSGSRIILYGAGRVGINYYRQIYRQGIVHMVLWVDQNFMKYTDTCYPVVSPDQITACEYEYIIISVKKEELADEIRKELTGKGIADKKILWRMPAIL